MEDSKGIFTEVIKRQMAILGPDITLAKVKNVRGIEIDATGTVTKLEGDPKVLLSELINQFVELSGLIVKKTMESILMSNPGGLSMVGQIANDVVAPSASPGGSAVVPPPGPAPVQNTSQPMRNDTDSNIVSANSDIEELNKILNNYKHD